MVRIIQRVLLLSIKIGAKAGSTFEKTAIVWFIKSKMAQGKIRLDKKTKKDTMIENLSWKGGLTR
jgi:hypothetical protein